MSTKKKRRQRRHTTCSNCGDKRAVFKYNGKVKADRLHDLCPRCYRSAMDRLHASFLQAAS